MGYICLGTHLLCNNFEGGYDGCRVGTQVGQTGGVYNPPGDISNQWITACSRNRWIAMNQIQVPQFVERRVVGLEAASSRRWYYIGSMGLSNSYWPDRFYATGIFDAFTLAAWTCPFIPSERPDREDLLGNIVRDLEVYSAYTDEFTWQADYFACNFLYDNPSFLDLGHPDDGLYQAWLNDMAQQSIGKFKEVYEKIEIADYIHAAALLTEITPVNTIETNMKAALEIFLESFAVDVELNESQILTLTDIANQYAFFGGQGVIFARAMLNIDVDEQYGEPRLAESIVHAGDNVENSNAFFPNPAQNIIYLPGKYLSGGAVQVKIFSLTGKLISSFNVKEPSGELILPELPNGAYFIELVSKENAITGKLIVSR